MATIDRYLGKVFHADAFDLLKTMPVESVDACVADGMYGVKSPFSVYEWGPDPANGDPDKHWRYHKPIYEECRRVLKPGGVLAWSAGVKFYRHFNEWFGGHRVWTLTRFGKSGIASGHIWVVQTKEQQPLPYPDRDGVILYEPLRGLSDLHPCPKPVEEMAWIIEALTKPSDIILDCFCGLGSTLLAAEQLGRRWIGCDRSRRYCQIALRRLKRLHTAA
jgi:site-specific DNA-methyltransferase (adenine-specific)